jgi:hypothetical protein
LSLANERMKPLLIALISLVFVTSGCTHYNYSNRRPGQSYPYGQKRPYGQYGRRDRDDRDDDRRRDYDNDRGRREWDRDDD